MPNDSTLPEMLKERYNFRGGKFFKNWLKVLSNPRPEVEIAYKKCVLHEFPVQQNLPPYIFEEEYEGKKQSMNEHLTFLCQY